MDDDSRMTDVVAPANDSDFVYEMSEAESVTEAVTAALSSASRTPERELEPLYATIDPDALDSLFGPRGNGVAREADGHVAFEHDSFRVRVESSGIVALDRLRNFE